MGSSSPAGVCSSTTCPIWLAGTVNSMQPSTSRRSPAWPPGGIVTIITPVEVASCIKSPSSSPSGTCASARYMRERAQTRCYRVEGCVTRNSTYVSSYLDLQRFVEVVSSSWPFVATCAVARQRRGCINGPIALQSFIYGWPYCRDSVFNHLEI